MSKQIMKDLIPTERIAQAIFLIRGQKVMLDYDLAKLYGVQTRILNQAVKRNAKRFPGDFMFRLNLQEVRNSRSQTVILKQGHNVKYRPHAFTEHGILMLSSVLNSEGAVQVNIEISIQGYRRNKIYPDFVVQQGHSKKPVASVVVVESKGKHLKGNEDTNYKRTVAGYFKKVGRKIPWQKLGEDFQDETFRFQVLDEGEYADKDWQDDLRKLLESSLK